MIKISYEQKPYHFDNVGGQGYKEETIMTLEEDITSKEAIVAFVRLLNKATYRVYAETLKELAKDLEEEYGDERIL